MATTGPGPTRTQRFFQGHYGRLLLPGVILQSVLIGGGYATGREIVEFGAKFGDLGWIAGVFIVVGFALMAFLMFEIARRFQAFDYRTLLQKLIGRCTGSSTSSTSCWRSSSSRSWRRPRARSSAPRWV